MLIKLEDGTIVNTEEITIVRLWEDKKYIDFDSYKTRVITDKDYEKLQQIAEIQEREIIQSSRPIMIQSQKSSVDYFMEGLKESYPGSIQVDQKGIMYVPIGTDQEVIDYLCKRLEVNNMTDFQYRDIVGFLGHYSQATGKRLLILALKEMLNNQKE